jgi:hypothetical protein
MIGVKESPGASAAIDEKSKQPTFVLPPGAIQRPRQDVHQRYDRTITNRCCCLEFLDLFYSVHQSNRLAPTFHECRLRFPADHAQHGAVVIRDLR